GHGRQETRRRVTEMEFLFQRRQGHDVQHEVHGVEHPAELGRQKRLPLLPRDGAIPRYGRRWRHRSRRGKRWRVQGSDWTARDGGFGRIHEVASLVKVRLTPHAAGPGRTHYPSLRGMCKGWVEMRRAKHLADEAGATQWPWR